MINEPDESAMVEINLIETDEEWDMIEEEILRLTNNL